MANSVSLCAHFVRTFVFFVLASVMWMATTLEARADGILTFGVTRGATGGTIGVLNTVGDDVCPAAATNGCDFSQTDDVVRTNDGVGYNFAVQVDPPGDNVFIRSTLKPGLVWDQLPGICNAVTSSISGDGSAGAPSEIFCDLGFRSSFAADITFVARALGDNPNGTTSGIASAEFGGDNCDSILPDVSTIDDVTITAKPHYNLFKRVLTAAPASRGGVDGFQITYEFHVDTWKTDTNGDPTDDPDPLFGNETAMGPISFVEDASGISPNAYVYDCFQGNSVRYPLATFSATQPSRSVLDAGSVSCDATGLGVQTPTVTVTGADLSLSHFPTQTRSGTALPGDRRIASFGTIGVFVPLTDITAAGGQIATVNTYGNISLTSVTGQSNFAGAPQDANGGEADGDNSVSFLIREGTGTFSHTYRCVTASNPAGLDCPTWFSAPTTATLVASGDGAAEPTQEFASYSFYRNQRFSPVTDAAVCSVFDDRYYEPVAYNGVDAARCHGTCGTLGVDYIFEYGVGYESTAFRDATVTAADAIGAECRATTGWFPSLADAEAAGDVSKVRMTRLTPLPAGGTFAVSTRLFALPFADLTSAANGTLLRTWGTATSSGFFPDDWRDCTYTAGEWPAISHATNGCGDRLYLSRALARIEKRTVPNNLVNTLDAGGFVTFELAPSFTSRSDIVDTVTIVDTLPAGGIYVPGTATQGGAPFEPTVTGSAATGQTLTWDLGTLTSNVPIETFQFDMRTPLTTPNGTNLDNVARIDAPSDSSSPEQRGAVRRVTVTAPASMLMAKSVDVPLVPQGGSFNYTIQYLNTTGFPFNEMDIIDILPSDGDGRFPSSDFSGTLTLASLAPQSTSAQFYFTSDPVAGLASDPNLASNDFAAGGTNWCPATAGHTVNPGASPTNGGASSACPSSFADVTAFRLVDTQPLDPASLRELSFEVLTSGNFGGDLYVNQAQGTSDGISLAPQTPFVQTRVIENGALGVSKATTDVTGNVVTFNLRVENLGNTPINNISLIDDLDLTFGAGTYQIEAAPSFVAADASGGVALNAGFTGTGSQTDMFAAGSSLLVGEFAIVEIQVRLNEVTDQGNGFGVYENSATTRGTSPSGVALSDVSDDGLDPDADGDGDPSGAGENDPTPVVVAVDQGIEVVKSSSTALLSDPITVGDEIEYTFVIENTGNVLLSNVALDDPLFTPSDITNTCVFPEPGGALKPGETATCTARYSIDQDDIDAAGVTNTAIASGDGPDGPVEDTSDSGNPNDETGGDADPTTTALPVPSVGLTKVGVENFSSPVVVGDTVTYTLVVTNTGNIDLSDISIADDLSNADGDILAYDAPGIVWQSATDGSPVGALTPGAMATYTATYSLTQADINSGRIENTAEVTADNEAGIPVSDVSDDPSDPSDDLVDDDPADPTVSTLSAAPGIRIIKAVEAAPDTNGDGLYGGENDVVVYRFTVTNIGNVSLTGITVTDPIVTLSGGPIDLDVGACELYVDCEIWALL